MRPLLYICSFLAVMALGFWAYRENYATQDALREVAQLEDEIGALREARAIQRAEWAYLNRPDRLRELVAVNFMRLPLMPMDSSQFARAGEVAYPPPPVAADMQAGALEITDPVDVSGTLESQDQQFP